MQKPKFIAGLRTAGTLSVHSYVVDKDTITDDRAMATEFDNKLTAGNTAIEYVDAHKNDELIQLSQIIVLPID